MKIQLTSYGTTFTVETDNDDVGIDQYLDIMTGLLKQATFSELTIKQAIIELAEQYENNYDTRTI
jgi:hypothetical protein